MVAKKKIVKRKVRLRSRRKRVKSKRPGTCTAICKTTGLRCQNKIRVGTRCWQHPAE
jgi:hypothetical protein